MLSYYIVLSRYITRIWGIEKPMHHILGYIGFMYDSHGIPYIIHTYRCNLFRFLECYTHLYS